MKTTMLTIGMLVMSGVLFTRTELRLEKLAVASMETVSEEVDVWMSDAEVMSTIVKMKDNKFLLTLYSKEATTLKVTLRDKQKNILFADKIKVVGSTAKVINIDRVESDVLVEVVGKDGVVKSAVLKK